MKKWLIIVLFSFIFLLSGCSKNISNIKFKNSKSFKNLNEVEYPDTEYLAYTQIDKSIKHNQYNYLNSFASITAKELFVSKQNYIYSPISLYMALGMLAQGADGQTLDQILTLLQSGTDKTLDDINNDLKNIYTRNYYSNDKGMIQMANSIWINNNFEVKQGFLDDLSTNYFAKAYNTNFDEQGKQNIVDWINHYTKDLLKIKKDNYIIDESTALLLLNTIYFDNKWEEEFKSKNNYKDIFYTEQEIEVEYMKHTVSSMYYEGDTYEIFYDYFKNSNKIKFIFPKENSSIDECLEKNIVEKELDHTTGLINVELTLSLPKFETKSSYLLNDVLSNLGVDLIFDESANFSKISDKDLLVTFVKQDAGIILNEEGVKAAAVTGIGMAESAAPGDLITRVLNRPFIYVIQDNNNVPLFVGIIYNPNMK